MFTKLLTTHPVCQQIHSNPEYRKHTSSTFQLIPFFWNSRKEGKENTSTKLEKKQNSQQLLQLSQSFSKFLKQSKWYMCTKDNVREKTLEL